MAAIGALLAMPLAGAAAHRYGSRAASALAMVAATAWACPASRWRRAWSGSALALLVLGAASGALDVAMNAQGVAVERRYRRPIMSSLHGMFSLGGMAGPARPALIAAAGIGALAALPRRSARWSRSSGVAACGRCCAPPRGGRAGAGLRAAVAGDPVARRRGARGPARRGRRRRLERGLSPRQPRRRHRDRRGRVRRVLARDGGRPLQRRPPGRAARRRSVVRAGGALAAPASA